MQDTNLNVNPYFDDFDKSTNYQKVLFKPGFSVQTRELNTIQSIFQNQIESFGQHVFKEGSVVIPGNVGYNLAYDCVLVQNFVNGISVESYRKSLLGRKIKGATSGVTAEIIDTLSVDESKKDIITFYIKYISSGFFEAGEQLQRFKNNEILVDTATNSPVAVTTVQNATDYVGSVAYINPGIYFIKGFFVQVPYQKIFLEQYSNAPSYKVGLLIRETVVTAEDDNTLFDNAIGTTNYSAPGADRLKIEAVFSKQNLLITEDSVFIELLRLNEGKEIRLVNNSIYNELDRSLARRTFDESGSYTLTPFTTKVREALSDGENNGVYSLNQVTLDGIKILNRYPFSNEETAVNGNDYYAVEVSKGKAYVKGFEIDCRVNQFQIVEKPRKVNSLQNQAYLLNIGSYVKLQNVKGSLNFGEVVDIKDDDDVSIGTARVFSVSNNNLLYISDVSIYVSLTLSGPLSVQTGDFITSSGGATGFVDGISETTIRLRQITGTFLPGSTITNSRNLSVRTVSSVTLYNLENARRFVNDTDFEAEVFLEEVKLSGTSFTVSGTSLTGTDTKFLSELSSNSKVRLGSGSVEVSSISSNGNTVTLESTFSDGTYYSAVKLVCKLYDSNKTLTISASKYPVKQSTDYIYFVSRRETFTVNQSSLTISKTDVIDANSIIVTDANGIVTGLIVESLSANTIRITGLTSNQTYNVYYKFRIGNGSARRKVSKKFSKLLVDKTTQTSSIYGARITDSELSLKFPDVYKIHAIHESTVDSSSDYQKYFDKLVLNTLGNNEDDIIVEGDIIESDSIRAKVIEIIDNTTVRVIYLSTEKFASGTNIAIPVNIPTNLNATGRFIKESAYGNYKDITENYTLVKNDTHDFYRVSKLVKKYNKPVPTRSFIVIFDYFEASELTDSFFTVDSYEGIDFKDIPNAFDNNPLSDIIDFRYQVNSSSTSGTSGTLSSPYRESSTSSPLDFKTNTINSSTDFIYPNSIFTMDYDFYLGRIDRVYITETGNIVVSKGSESLTPLPPEEDTANLLIATITIPPYLKRISDVSVEFNDSKRYTMKDIGKLDKRLTNVEKYTSLNLLEVNTNNLNILDENGNNRFKNGFIVDKFNTFLTSDRTNPDFSVSLDTENALIRPYPYVNNIGFKMDTETGGIIKTGELITLPYTEVVYIEQPYSSRVENLQPFEVTYYTGSLTLQPRKDVWFDTIRTPGEQQVVDLSEPIRFLFDNSGAAGDQWNAWQTANSQRVAGGTSFTDTRNGVNNSFNVTQRTIEAGDTFENIEDLVFVRSSIINVTATGLKPNTKFNLFIDDANSSQYFYPKLLTGLQGNTVRFVVGETVEINPFSLGVTLDNPLLADVVNPYEYTNDTNIIGSDFTNQGGYQLGTSILAIDNIRSSDGSLINPRMIGSSFTITGRNSRATATCTGPIPNIISNQNGVVHAFILIPAQTFNTGILKITVVDSTDGNLVKGFSTSTARSEYFAQGSEINLTSNVTSLTLPEITTTPISGTRTRFVADPPPPPPPPRPAPGRPRPRPPAPRRGDPLAQSFFIEEEEGLFVTSMDLYFYTKDDTSPVTITIRTMENGQPTETIVPYSTTTVNAEDIKVSVDASVPTKFTFPSPVYLSSQSEYCFVVFSSSKNYYLWVSRLSEQDVTTQFFIDKQPYVGVLFKSANQSTWESDQFEDIKFKLNRASFVTNTTKRAILKNNIIPKVKLNPDSLKFTQNSASIKVFQPNHGMHSINNYVSITGVVSDTPNAVMINAITSITTSIQFNDLSGSSLSTSSGFWNLIDGEPVSESNPGFLKIGDEIMKYISVINNTFTVQRAQENTTASSHPAGSIVECYNINGIPLQSVNKEHKISRVLNIDEYEIIVSNNANIDLIAGGKNIIASRNIQFESITPKINIFTPRNASSSLTMNSVTATSIGNTQQQSFIPILDQSIENNIENEFISPRMAVSEVNRNRYLSNRNSSLDVNINFSTTSDFVSPVLDVDGSSVITITNRINREVTASGDLDISSELLPYGGLHSSYVTKKISLENYSTAIKVFFDGIRRQDVDIKVFAKIKSSNNLGNFNNMNYIEIPSISYPSSKNNEQYGAFEYELTGLQEFKEWSIKIIFIGNDQSVVPKIKNFRAIALAV
jgi:hypothetical protein